MRLLFAAILLLLASTLSAAAFDDPKALVEAYYAQYDNPSEERFAAKIAAEPSFRSAPLNALYAADEKEAGEEGGRIDFDPFVDNPEASLSNLVVSEPVIDGDTATVALTVNNFGEPREMVITAVKEADGWKIDDVQRIDGDYPYSLRAILEAPL
jgi:hypothetical protein